ncbi:MAG TPA: class I SAM-dependent methyltransferase [Sphingomonas sp.]
MELIAHDRLKTASARRGFSSVAGCARDRQASTAAYYEVFGEEYAAQTMRIDVSDHIARFAGMLVPGARVLDAGCGAGRDLVALALAGLDPVGLDNSARLVRIAERTSGLSVALGDLRAPPYEVASFDGIWAMASLLHLERDETTAALRTLGELLVPGGLLFASVKRGVGQTRDNEGRWFTLHDEQGWDRHLREAGFELLEVTGEPPSDHGAIGIVSPGWISSLSRRPI